MCNTGNGNVYNYDAPVRMNQRRGCKPTLDNATEKAFVALANASGICGKYSRWSWNYYTRISYTIDGVAKDRLDRCYHFNADDHMDNGRIRVGFFIQQSTGGSMNAWDIRVYVELDTQFFKRDPNKPFEFSQAHYDRGNTSFPTYEVRQDGQKVMSLRTVKNPQFIGICREAMDLVEVLLDDDESWFADFHDFISTQICG